MHFNLNYLNLKYPYKNIYDDTKNSKIYSFLPNNNLLRFQTSVMDFKNNS